jgi:hypothetical protein
MYGPPFNDIVHTQLHVITASKISVLAYSIGKSDAKIRCAVKVDVVTMVVVLVSKS